MTSPVRAGRGPLLARAGDPPSPPHRRLMGARSSVTARRDLGSSTPAATRSDEDNASPLSSSGQHGDGAPRAAAAQIRPAAVPSSWLLAWARSSFAGLDRLSEYLLSFTFGSQ
uniref:Uncharacterized protein n=1 Tax=Oryza glaberrima TaxID=4538 RepID=I1QTK6_ORYGL